MSRYGVMPLSWSLDTCGPMARTVEDCAILLNAIAGFDARDSGSVDHSVVDYRAVLGASLRGVRVGVPRTWLDATEALDPEVRTAFELAVDELRGAGAVVTDVDGKPFIDARIPQMVIMLAEAYAYHEATLKSRPQDLGAVPRTRLREASVLSAADYIQAQRVRSALVKRIHEIFEQVDVLLPCGSTAGGLPVGLQIADRSFDEPTVLRVAAAYQHATDWHLRAPNLAGTDGPGSVSAPSLPAGAADQRRGQSIRENPA